MPFENVLNIARLDLYETGTYDAQYSRPYQFEIYGRTMDDLANRVHQATRANPLNHISPDLVSGLSSGLLMPAATWERELVIPNGWNTRRLCFHMELHERSHFGVTIYYVEGYTDHYGVSLQSAFIDPQMRFYVNSVAKLERAADYGNIGMVADTISDNFQIVNGPQHSLNTTAVYALRPEDVFTGVQSKYTSDVLNIENTGIVLDDRIDHSNDIFRSRRDNAVGSSYIARVIDTYRQAATLADFGQGQNDILGRAIQRSYETSPYENAFIRALSDHQHMQTITTFTLADLKEIDPSVKPNVYEMTAGLYHAGSMQGWGGADLETQIATIVRNAVPGLMIANNLKTLGFTSSNMNIGGQTVTIGHEGSEPFGIAHTPTPLELARFFQRFSSEVMPDITTQRGVTIPVHIDVWCDVFGNITIQVSVNGAPAVPYTAPVFCDSLTAPVTTINPETYQSMVHGMESVYQACDHGMAESRLSFNGVITTI